MDKFKLHVEIGLRRANSEGSNIPKFSLVKDDSGVANAKIATPGDTPIGIAKPQAISSSDDLTRHKDGTLTEGDIWNSSTTLFTVIARGYTNALIGSGDSITVNKPIMMSTTNNGCIEEWKPGHRAIGHALETSSTAGEVSIYLDCMNLAEEINDYQEITSAGAITIDNGQVDLKTGGADEITLAAPSRAGNTIYITAKDAKAYTVVNASPGFDGGGAGADTLTFGGAIGDGCRLFSVDNSGTLQWNLCERTNVTAG